ncbi:hypothetical protein MCEMIE11_00610 [Burkholderiales bacterium]
MSWIAGLVLFGLGLFVIARISGAVLQILEALSSGLLRLLGNARKGCELHIPEVLRERGRGRGTFEHSPDPNEQLIQAIRRWIQHPPSPKIPIFQAERPYEAVILPFVERVEDRCRQEEGAPITVHEGTIPNLLSPSAVPPIEDLLEISQRPAVTPYADLTFNPKDIHGFPTSQRPEDVPAPTPVEEPTLVPAAPYRVAFLPQPSGEILV